MSPPEVRCSCGAINDVAFDSCIRCGLPLGRDPRKAAPAPAPTGILRAGKSALLIAALCAFVFAVELVFELKAGGGFPILGGNVLAAIRAGALYSTDDVVRMEPFRFLSAVYVHFGLLHFGLNMIGLFNQAKVADSVVGAARTMIVFVVGGIVGYLSTYGVQLVSGSAPVPTAGASGGLLAVMGLILGVMLRRKMPGFLSQAGNVLFYVVLFGFAVNATKSSIMINNSAHIGGLLCGFAFGYLWGKSGTSAGAATRITAVALFLASVGSIALALSSNLYKLLSAG